jgi:hypothetical protein
MNKEEAIAWLTGERTMANMIPQDPFDTWQVRIAQADAAMCAQAYYVLMAYNNGLVPVENCKHCDSCGEKQTVEANALARSETEGR